MKTGYLGPEGSYSHLAATYMRPNSILLSYVGFPQLIAALKRGETDGAVVPVENALNGGIAQVMDLLQANPELVATEEYVLGIDHRLITQSGAELSGITRIYSHGQALEQCSAYLSENFPDAKLIACQSTAAGLDMIKSPSDACIAGAHTLRGGLQISSEDVSDEKNNHTRFLYVRKGKIDENARSRRVYFSVTCPNVPGGLLRLLEPIFKNGLNMTRIESRPIKDREEEYRFFIETEGDYSSQDVKNALKEVERAGNSFRLIGCY